MSATLKPCPFCNSSNVRVDVGLMEFTDGEVSCQKCGGSVGNHPSKDEAIAAWNRRADGWQPIETARTYEFDRYVNGVLMAEGVTIERAPDLGCAMIHAARIASRGPARETPVLILKQNFLHHASSPSAEAS